MLRNDGTSFKAVQDVLSFHIREKRTSTRIRRKTCMDVLSFHIREKRTPFC